jgi:hypothetical protein
MAKGEFELLGEGYLRIGRPDQAKLAFGEVGKKMGEPDLTKAYVTVAMKAYQGATPMERWLIKGDQFLVDGDLVKATVFYRKAESMC